MTSVWNDVMINFQDSLSFDTRIHDDLKIGLEDTIDFRGTLNPGRERNKNATNLENASGLTKVTKVIIRDDYNLGFQRQFSQPNKVPSR